MFIGGDGGTFMDIVAGNGGVIGCAWVKSDGGFIAQRNWL